MPRPSSFCVAVFALASFTATSFAHADDDAPAVEDHVVDAPLHHPPTSRWSLDLRLGTVTPFGAFGSAQTGVSLEAEVGLRLAGPFTVLVFGEHDLLARGQASDTQAPSSDAAGALLRVDLGGDDLAWIAQVGGGLRFSRFSRGDDHGSAGGYELRAAFGPSIRLADGFALELLAQAAWMKPTSFHDLSLATAPSSGVLGFSVGGSWSL